MESSIAVSQSHLYYYIAVFVQDVDEVNLDQFWNPKLFIDDALGSGNVTSSLKVERTSGGLSYIVERRRIKGSFIEKLELENFPFDVQVSVLLILYKVDVHPD